MPQFLVLATDHTDAGALPRRLAVRKAHLERMKIEKAAGRFITGGAKLNNEEQMYGSMLVVVLENIAVAWEWVNADPYVTGRVWNEIEILPFRIADV